MSAKINAAKLCERAREIKAKGGVQDDLVKMYTAHPVGSEGFKKVKQNIVQALTNTRKALTSRLMKERGLSEEDAKEKVATLVPSFRTGRPSGRKSELDDLFGELLDVVDEEMADETDDENVDIDVETEVTA